MAENNPTLSLVVPVYNVEKFLPECLDSLCKHQSVEKEVILIDDGSTDASPMIIKEYAEKYSFVRLIKQKNQGLGAARNAGLDSARGNFIAFVDSDDFVLGNTYDECIDIAKKESLEILMFNGWYYYPENGRKEIIYRESFPDSVISGSDWISLARLGVKFFHYAPLNIYNAEFIACHRLRFPVDRIHEDVIWTSVALTRASRVKFIPDTHYFYRQRARVFSEKENQIRLEKVVRSSVDNARDLDQLLKQSELPDKTVDALKFQLVDGGLSVFHKIKKMPDRKAASSLRRKLVLEGYLRLLLSHADNFSQRRKILKQLALASIGR